MFRQSPISPAFGRQQIIDLFIVRAAPADREQLRRVLERMTLDELKTAHEALQAQNYLQIREEELARITVESEADRILPEESMRLAREPQRLAEEKAQLEADRKTFVQAAKTFQSFSVNEANFNVTRQILGPGFSTWDIQQALSSNGLQLSPATSAELSEWTREAEKAEIRRLKSMDLLSLRKLVREEGERGPVTPPLDETQRIRQEERDAGTVYEKLPPDISAEDILAASVSKLKFLKQKYGNAQLDAVLNDYRQANSVINKF